MREPNVLQNFPLATGCDGPSDERDSTGSRLILPAMIREGDYWTILFRGRLIHARHNKGIVYLAHMIARPWASVHVSDLYGLTRGDRDRRRAPSDSARLVESNRKAVTSRIRAAVAGFQRTDVVLGEHFASTVTTGTRCVYSPRPPAIS